MSDLAPVIFSAFAVFGLVLLMSRKFNISSRYERKPKVHTPWSALDNGIDPSEKEVEK
jgi:hypothetical protein